MIELKNICLSFDKKVIFNDFNYTFETGKNHAILGPSGCGKSTLLRIIAGLLKPDSGEVFYNGKLLTKPNKDIFMMHQVYANFPWLNCLDNVLLPISINTKVTKEHIEEAQDILKNVGLGEFINKYPYKLSGGMKQRLALARVLMSKPPVILMDEPTSALDEKTRIKMEDLLLEVDRQHKNLIIMVTHNQEAAKKIAEKIIELK